MAEFTQLPGELNLRFTQGDQVILNCDFDVNVTGYTITNVIYVADSYSYGGGGSGFITTAGATVTTFDQSITNASTGLVTLDLPENKSALLSPVVSYRWYLRWVDTNSVTRTILSGSVTPVSP